MPKNILLSATVALAFVGMTGAANADLVISQKKSVNVTCSAGICNATAANAVLNVKDLTNMLVTTDVHVFAEGVATDITVADPFSWASSHQLTLGAYGSINVKAAISITGTSGLTIITNIANTGGIFRLVGVGKISFWDTASTLVINGTTYTMVNNLPALIAAVAANPSGTYAFANDYDATQDGSYPHSPIPTTFTGVFEGLGNAISNLSINNTNPVNDNIALFYNVGTGGQLSDVNVTNVSMQANSAYLASLVGTNNGAVMHCSASGTIATPKENFSVAGLVVDNNGAITRSHSTVNMTGYPDSAGGLVGTNDGSISLSDASGSVSAAAVAGGLASSSIGEIAFSSASGSVSVRYSSGATAGGLVGEFSSGTIEQSFATGAVQDGTFHPGKLNGNMLGGLVGLSGGAISYAYATGSVSQGGHQFARVPSVGGLVGHASSIGSTVNQAYVLGKLSLKRKYLGGVIGTDDSVSGSNNNTFWDLDTTGVENTNQGAGNEFDDKGLSGIAESKFRKATAQKFDPTIWAENSKINNGYPYLIANPPPPPQ